MKHKVKIKAKLTIIVFIIYLITQFVPVYLMTKGIVPETKWMIYILFLGVPVLMYVALFKFCYYTDDGTSPAKIMWTEIKQSEMCQFLYGLSIVLAWLGVSAGLLYWGYKLDSNLGGILQWIGFGWAGFGYLLLMGMKRRK